MIKQCLLIVVFLFAVSNNVAWSAGVGVEQAVKNVKKQYSGKVLKAEKIKSKGPKVFKVKLLLPGGRVKNVFVDGATGQVFEP
ncbi:hypothetical protein A9Q81_26740 [Gammaproteobacteria bacterium 42_54_T18]|nr:hypothetical protein A9Q81_26740 [Gammaproteobacteria bacterium 42_54_T18]